MATKGETFVSVFDRMRRETPSKECYVAYDVTMKRTALTFQEMWTLSARFAHDLKEHGLQLGDYVVIITPNSLEHTVATFGVMMAGGCAVPMEKLFHDCLAIRETIKLTKAKLMILPDDDNATWEYFKENAKDISRDTMSAKYQDGIHTLRQIVFTPKTRGRWKVGFLDRLGQSQQEFVCTRLTPGDGSMVGSSLNPGVGVPKLVEHSHGSFVKMARKWGKAMPWDKAHFVYPLYLLALFPWDVVNGRTRVITDFLEAPVKDMTEHVMSVKKAEGLSHSLITPIDISKIASALTPTDKPYLKQIVSGGMPMTNAFFENATTIADTVSIVYMITETWMVTVNNRPPGSGFTPFDCGPLADDVQVRVVDSNQQDVARGVTGMILVKCDCMFQRYVGEPEKTASVLTNDGWFITNDTGYLGSDGHLTVYGRKSDAISRGIVLTYPAWLEKPLASHPEVLEVTVVGVPDDLNFRNTCACVVTRPGSQLTEKNLVDIVHNSMTGDGNDYFVLDYALLFDTPLPKVSREELGEIAAKKLGLLSSN